MGGVHGMSCASVGDGLSVRCVQMEGDVGLCEKGGAGEGTREGVGGVGGEGGGIGVRVLLVWVYGVAAEIVGWPGVVGAATRGGVVGVGGDGSATGVWQMLWCKGGGGGGRRGGKGIKVG